VDALEVTRKPKMSLKDGTLYCSLRTQIVTHNISQYNIKQRHAPCWLWIRTASATLTSRYLISYLIAYVIAYLTAYLIAYLIAYLLAYLLTYPIAPIFSIL
jgi:hypothetical protein